MVARRVFRVVRSTSSPSLFAFHKIDVLPRGRAILETVFGHVAIRRYCKHEGSPGDVVQIEATNPCGTIDLRSNPEQRPVGIQI